MPDDQERFRRVASLAEQVQELRRRGLVHAAVELDWRFGSEPRLGELPRLTGTAGRGAQHLVGHMVGSAQPAPHDGRIPTATLPERPLMVRHVGPSRLSMPQQHKLPAYGFRHVHSFAG